MKGLKNGVGLFSVQIVRVDLEHARLVRKPFIDGLRHMRHTVGVELFFNVQEQNLIELCDRFGAPVVLFHQGLAGCSGRSSGSRHIDPSVQPKLLGHLRLKVKDQTILASLGHQMQAHSDQVQKRFIFLDHSGL